jgi:hypothetical protein
MIFIRLRELKFWLKWKNKKILIEKLMNKNKLNLLKFLTITKLVMIQIFKNIVPK